MKSIAAPITEMPRHSWFAGWLRMILITLQAQHHQRDPYQIENEYLLRWQEYRDEIDTCRYSDQTLHKHIVSSVDILIDELQKRNDGVPAQERRMIDIQDIHNLSAELRRLEGVCKSDIGIKY